MQSTKVAGISDLALAASTVLESSTQRGAGVTSSRSSRPCSTSRARLTPAAAPVKPAACSMLIGTRKLG